MESPRSQAISTVLSRKPRKIEFPKDERGQVLKVSDYFGVNAFGPKQMKEKLPSDTFNKLQRTIESGAKLDLEIANVVANAVKDWAVEHGVSHFCHWFQPRTGTTAEKHDAFLAFDKEEHVIQNFSGSQLIQSEPDASSFPSGGMRSTFEARGYTAWDPSSPMFILEATNTKTLCIPSAFISYHGHALDQKTGLLRSNEALSEKVCHLLKLLGEKATRVTSTVGTEQEYFLLDRAFYALRPDLIMSGRTLVGAQPAKGQQLSDHYFGSIPNRVQAFMGEAEYELYRLGVPVKTRHNEVAPSQFECAPIFEDSNVAVDHNHLIMEVLRKVARRHDFEVLLHEKPFAELNGNGKHTNWSLSLQDNGDNLLDPGATPYQNLRFLLSLCAILKGVQDHAGLLRSAIASSGNDHRLGANEAPPAIVSVFLGETLSRILDEIETKGAAHESDSNPEALMIKMGVNKLPVIRKDNTDRNRTSPFAFTGNKFEFRAVGANATPARAVTYLNAAVADGFTHVAKKLEEKLNAGKTKEVAILAVLQEFTKETKRIRFEGNNYSDEWVREAESRGLPHLRKTPEALNELLRPSSMKLLTEMKIFDQDEIQSRYNTRLERYSYDILIEAQSLRSIIDTQILPACFHYHRDLMGAVDLARKSGVGAVQKDTLDQLTDLIEALKAKRDSLVTETDSAEAIGDPVAEADFLANRVCATMEAVRDVADRLEELVEDRYWPLPKYREMLFIS